MQSESGNLEAIYITVATQNLTQVK